MLCEFLVRTIIQELWKKSVLLSFGPVALLGARQTAVTWSWIYDYREKAIFLAGEMEIKENL